MRRAAENVLETLKPYAWHGAPWPQVTATALFSKSSLPRWKDSAKGMLN
jgi:hypothetical protein